MSMTSAAGSNGTAALVVWPGRAVADGTTASEGGAAAEGVGSPPNGAAGCILYARLRRIQLCRAYSRPRGCEHAMPVCTYGAPMPDGSSHRRSCSSSSKSSSEKKAGCPGAPSTQKGSKQLRERRRGRLQSSRSVGDEVDGQVNLTAFDVEVPIPYPNASVGAGYPAAPPNVTRSLRKGY